MIDEIKYKGLTATPSDYDCLDGELAASVNIINEDNALQPIAQPKALLDLPTYVDIICLHVTSNIKHYIAKDGRTNTLFWLDKNILDARPDKPVQLLDININTEIHTFANNEKIESITPIGNTLVVLTNKGMHYVLWLGDKYEYLGTHIPELPISFGLNYSLAQSEEIGFVFPKDDDNKESINQAIHAAVNKYIADTAREGQFIFPFLIRYAYRLYDGSLTMHSSPVLMMTATQQCPLLYDSRQGVRVPGELGIAFWGKVTSLVHSLDYQVKSQDSIEQLEKWKDLVQSVDVFISAPIYIYDQEGDFKSLETSRKTYTSYTDEGSSGLTTHRFVDFVSVFSSNTGDTDPKFFNLPYHTEEEVMERIASTSQFFFLQSLRLDDLGTQRKKIDIPENYLPTLIARESMTDDYDSHDILIPQQAFNYNSRLSIALDKKKPYNNFDATALFLCTDGEVTLDVYIYIKEGGKTIIVKGSGQVDSYQPFYYLAYPNSNAYKAVIVAGTKRYELALKKHPFLNCAYYSGTEYKIPDAIPTPTPDGEDFFSYPNKLYTSEVNNPFRFPVTGINTIGTGKIIGLSAATKALSEGQFGQFPLYAFTTDGVWALEVSSTGSFSAKQPVTRDVCSNPDSITQIDTAVVFATERGIMMLSGADTICLTDIINNVEDITISIKNNVLPDGMDNNILDYQPFTEYLKNAQIIYDYINQRIIVYNDENDYSYIYSLKSKHWGMMENDTIYHINSYPNALAVNYLQKGEDYIHQVVDYSQPNYNNIRPQVIVTRPIKLQGDILKTIDTIIQRGHFPKGNVRQILYGSRDLYHWQTVWSSVDRYLRGFRGTPYKYYRIALISNLGKNESISGCTIQFNQRYNNQPR